MTWHPGTETPPEGIDLLLYYGCNYHLGSYIVTGDPEHDFYWSYDRWETKTAPEFWMEIPQLP